MQQSALLKSISHVKHGFFDREAKTETDVTEALAVERMIRCHQIHSADVLDVQDVKTWPNDAPKADGLVTQASNIALGIVTADCVPVLAVDRKRPIIAAVHAGWRGAFGGIVQNMIGRMVEKGAEVSDIVIALGPCIQQRSYEVDTMFYQNFLSQSRDNKTFFISSIKADHYMFDLPAYIKHRVLKDYPHLVGVDVLGVNTYTDDRFYSYRLGTHQNRVETGRQYSAIALV